MNKKPVHLKGIVRANEIDGLHYELEMDDEVFILLGNITSLRESLNCEVEIIGTLRSDETNTYKRGRPFDVESIKALEHSEI